MKQHNNDKKNNVESALYIVPTPIGNLDDITIRAKNILSSVDIIACEDTRRSGMLLKSLNIEKQNNLYSYFDHNEEQKSLTLINQILQGKSVALISDAGTPCISDPGYKIIQKAKESNIKIIPLPGATAFVPALIASGFANHCFIFMGFPPQKKGRKTFLNDVILSQNTTILYEASHRITKLISEIASLDSNRNISISREISKIYEEHLNFNTADFIQNKIKIVEKGEFVVVVEGKRN
jgi:16S rRNA (cytidine1402-2'-O)-methyltransferase